MISIGTLHYFNEDGTLIIIQNIIQILLLYVCHVINLINYIWVFPDLTVLVLFTVCIIINEQLV